MLAELDVVGVVTAVSRLLCRWGGLAWGGGIGFLQHKHGFSMDNILQVSCCEFVLCGPGIVLPFHSIRLSTAQWFSNAVC